MRHPLRPRYDDRRLTRDGRFVLRRLSAPLRGLPDFLIMGAMKSGTSSLFDYMVRHAAVIPPQRKETHYFDLGRLRGKRDGWYRAHFPMRRKLQNGAVTGEATPDYMFCPHADERIAARLPDVRLIVLLRNPVERAISHYFHEVRMGREYLPIAEAMACEEERLADAGDDAEGLETYLHASYKARGVYVDQIERLRRQFRTDRILVLGSKSLFEDPKGTVERAWRFVGLEPAGDMKKFEVKNQGVNREDVPAEVYDDLERFFAPHRKRLHDLLGWQVNW